MAGVCENPATIVAVASPAGTGAVSLFRISGPDALAVIARATAGGIDAEGARPRMALRCRILDGLGRTLDDGLAVFFRGPASFTGEDCVEFSGHGGMLVTREVLGRLLECGAVAAAPGEFTQRAFLNGKLDLTQAEGVMDLISAQTRLALQAARGQMDGALARRTSAARDRLLECIAHLEAWIDFPEEDIAPDSAAAIADGARAVMDEAIALLATGDQGRALREGVRTVIVGPPNAGKSSLLNRLLGCERAIVSEFPGTTRDTIEETVSIAGIPLHLVDTAGLRATSDRIEAAGVERAMRQIETAGLLLETADASQPPPAGQGVKGEGIRILVLNKCDLAEHPAWAGTDAVRVSCTTGKGLDALTEAIREALLFGDADWGEHSVAINARHQDCLRRTKAALAAALALLETPSAPAELAAVELREALDALGEIAGKLDTEDVLGAIFSRFCIGK